MKALGVGFVVAIALATRPASAAVCEGLDDGMARLLILSAYPQEMATLLARAENVETKSCEGRSFYVGELAENDVVMTLTGIGLVNARKRTLLALENFTVTGIVFSGVAGGKHYIGDVAIPHQWTDGTSSFEVDGKMETVARKVVKCGVLQLENCVPLPDLACTGEIPALATPLCVEQAPEIHAGPQTVGRSSDPFGDKAFPCTPLGGDVFGCEVCGAPPGAPDLLGFVSGVEAFLDPGLFQQYSEWDAPIGDDADDMETAAVARVAAEKSIPFIAFRAMSDGKGDPLMLPGFPAQFFVYQQLATRNAAAVASAFLEAWANRGATCP